MRLYKAWSSVDNYMNKECVIFNWFVVGREKPIGGYDELIDGYSPVDSEAWCDELMVNELFTEAEIGELRSYLKREHQIELYTEEVSLPLKSGELSYGLLLISGENNFYTLADEKNYNLSISVLGQFDAPNQKTPQLLSAEDIDKGLSFMNAFLKKLNNSNYQESELVSFLNEIYAETGYYIEKAKPGPNQH